MRTLLDVPYNHALVASNITGRTTMKLGVDEFRKWNRKAITLLGMSGVGKTRLACILRKAHWFHYSGDYRIGTRYLDEPILDHIKKELMGIPMMRELLRSDSIQIRNNITVDNLNPVSTFLGKLGNPEQGGLGLTEFKRRQELHRQAEIAAMKDVPAFIGKAHTIYGYDHFINDAGGSLCELDEPQVLETLAAHTLIIYIKASKEDEKELIRRAKHSPKPLYFREVFLDEQLVIYMSEKKLRFVALFDPDDFARWVFPRLFYSRLPRYEAIAAQYGYTITTRQAEAVQSEEDFLNLVEKFLNAKKQVG